MDDQLSFGECVRRLRRERRFDLQRLATATGLSVSYLSRIENDRVVPSTDAVLKLAAVLEGDTDRMLQLSRSLPAEILERLARRAHDEAPVLKRGVGTEGADPAFAKALVDDMDPQLRAAVAAHFRIAEPNVDGIFAALNQIGQMSAQERERLLGVLTALFGAGGGAGQ